MKSLCHTKCKVVWGVFCSLILLAACSLSTNTQVKPRILISTDIGGTDPDDNQSMIHLLMYADLFEIEGLVSSPYGKGTTSEIHRMIDLYQSDLDKLQKHSLGFPPADSLRKVVKQGSKDCAPYKGYLSSTEGSDWIVKCANKKSEHPLWILVWGGIEDLAQALHDDPGIKKNVKVYWIGGPNKKWSANAYAYIAEYHPDLWMIEANATYRGWFIDKGYPDEISNKNYFSNYIKSRGEMGKSFKNYYKGEIKMGDTPSLAYLMNGEPANPTSESWGGRFCKINRSSKVVFEGNSSVEDTVAAYSIIEWHFAGPELEIHPDTSCFSLEISKQVWRGYYLGEGMYGVRYASKKPEKCSYFTRSEIDELDGLTGEFISNVPWPGKPAKHDYILGENWYSDVADSAMFLGVQQGAKTVSMHREQFLLDWSERWKWLK